MSTPRSVSWAVLTFSAFLHVLPERVRSRHGEEIEGLFADLAHEAHERAGAWGVFRVWLRSSADLVLSRDLERAGADDAKKSKKSGGILDVLGQDLRLSLRSLLHKPGSTLTAIGSLAVGMSVTVGIFTFADTILWRGWTSFAEPDRVVQVFEQRDQYLLPSWPTFAAIEEGVDVFDGVLASQLDLFALGSDDGAETVAGERVSDGYFDMLGLSPVLGRFPSATDETIDGTLPVVISHNTWVTAFGGVGDVVGRSVRLNGHPAEVVAVAPDRLDGTKWGVSAELWVPVSAWARADGWTEWEDDRGLIVTVMGRMRDGVDVTTANAALAALAAGLAEDRPGAYEGMALTATDRLRGDMGPEIGVTADLIAVAAILAGVLVLLVGCGNVASLLLARGVLRTREVAVRYALGASRSRIVRQLLTEGLLLAVVAAGIGLLLSSYGTAALLELLPTFDFLVRFVTQPGPRSMALAAGLAIVTVVASVLAPALQLSRADLTEAMKTDAHTGLSSGRHRLLGSVVVGMVGASVLALFLAGVFGKTLRQGSQLEPGFALENRVRAVVPLRLAGHRWQDATELFEDLDRRLAELPGAVSVGYATGVPLGESWAAQEVYAGDRSYATGDAGIRSFRSSVSDDYFQAMGTRIVQGRTFGPEDGAEGPWAAIINEELAERLWPGEDPLGRSIRFGLSEDAEPVQVVGVAETGLYYMVGESPEPAVFASFRQWPEAQAMVVVHADGDPLELVPGIRAELAMTDPDVPLQRVRTLEAHFLDALWLHRLGASIGGTVSLLTVLMAAVGLYGVMAFTLGARRHEMGIRRALGAGRQSVLGLAVRGSLKLTGLGLLLGLMLSVLAGLALNASLVGVEPWDPGILIGTALFVLLLGTLSALAPGMSAARVDPVTALKTEL